MPIFTNNSTFPFDKFNLLNDSSFSTYSDIEKFVFIREEHKFRGNLIELINTFENQHLFQILSIQILRLTFNQKIPRILISEINSDSIVNQKEFVRLLNLKVNLEEITKELDKIENSVDASVNSKQFLSEIIIFTYKYLFVKLASLIYCNSIDGLKEPMIFKEHNDTFIKYSKKQEERKYTNLNYVSQKEYIKNYFKSFNTDDIKSIETTIEELNLFSIEKNLERKLNELIERSINIDSNLSAIKKNRLLLPFFKLVTCVFFHREFIDLENYDPTLIEYFKKFRLRMKK
jgi:hypothetical protein